VSVKLSPEFLEVVVVDSDGLVVVDGFNVSDAEVDADVRVEAARSD